MYSLHRREELPEAVADELDKLLAALKGFMSIAHNDDGTIRSDAVVVSDTDTSESQRWLAGPWLMGEPGQATATQPVVTVALQGPLPVWHDFNPSGLASAVVLEIHTSVDTVLMTGLAVESGGDDRRFLYLCNRGNKDILLFDQTSPEATRSEAQHRFALPGETDLTINWKSGVWLYYCSAIKRWTVAQT